MALNHLTRSSEFLKVMQQCRIGEQESKHYEHLRQPSTHDVAKMLLWAETQFLFLSFFFGPFHMNQAMADFLNGEGWSGQHEDGPCGLHDHSREQFGLVPRHDYENVAQNAVWCCDVACIQERLLAGRAYRNFWEVVLCDVQSLQVREFYLHPYFPPVDLDKPPVEPHHRGMYTVSCRARLVVTPFTFTTFMATSMQYGEQVNQVRVAITEVVEVEDDDDDDDEEEEEEEEEDEEGEAIDISHMR
jgi:hypothetical protein